LIKPWISTGISLGKVVILLILLLLTLQLKDPAFADLRTILFWGILAVECGLGLLEIFCLRKSRPRKIAKLWLVFLCLIGLTVLLGQAIQFQALKYQVLHQYPNQLKQLGQHFIVGYRSFNQVKTLVEQQAIAGIFITHRNVRGKTVEQIQQEIQTLQSIRQGQGLAPLWIAADQEGGIVSSLSPPLPSLPPLSQAIQGATPIQTAKLAVIHYAELQAKALANLGVNFNFAPILDLNQGIVVPGDRLSMIHKRAISSNPATVTEVAHWYCDTLAEYQIHCTIKHFPGLGRVTADTHTASARLETAIATLEQSDWLPFRSLMQNSSVLTMVGHVILTAIDPIHPASFSQAIISDLIRQDWQYEGVLITDDFGMQAIYNSEDGLSNAAIKAINAGIDIILLSFDQDLYYPAMQALIQAEAAGKLDQTMLLRSQTRIEAVNRQ
jgi:beta-N-acetylhexosaminidase